MRRRWIPANQNACACGCWPYQIRIRQITSFLDIETARAFLAYSYYGTLARIDIVFTISPSVWAVLTPPPSSWFQRAAKFAAGRTQPLACLLFGPVIMRKRRICCQHAIYLSF